MSKRPGKRLRQADLARIAGVSQATVSLVLSGRSDSTARIPSETRERVLRLAGELGYVANPVARSLAGGLNRLLGLFTFESVFPVDHHDFYYPFLKGIEAGAERHTYDLILFSSATGDHSERSIYHGEVNRLALADGCVIIGRRTNSAEIARLRDEGFHFVLVGRRNIPGGGVDYVTADYAGATEAIIDHLVELGHSRIAYLPASDRAEPTEDRDVGYLAACRRHGLEISDLVLAVDDDGPSSVEVSTLLKLGATAFVVHETTVALRAIDQIAARGLCVPQDISVAVLGDPPESVLRVTGFEIPRQRMAEAAVEILIRRIESATSPDVTHMALPCRFLRGETTSHLIRG